MSESILFDESAYRCGDALVATPAPALAIESGDASLWYIVEGADPRFDTRHLVDEREFSEGRGAALSLAWHPPAWQSNGVSLSWWVRIRSGTQDLATAPAHWRRLEVSAAQREHLPEHVLGDLQENARDIADKLGQRAQRQERRRIAARASFFILAGVVAALVVREASVTVPLFVLGALIGIGPRLVHGVRPGLRLADEAPVLMQGAPTSIAVVRRGWFRADTIRWQLVCRETRSYRPHRTSWWTRRDGLVDEVFDIEVDHGALNFGKSRRARLDITVPLQAPVTLWTETRRIQWLLRSRYRVAGVDQTTEIALPVIGVNAGAPDEAADTGQAEDTTVTEQRDAAR